MHWIDVGIIRNWLKHFFFRSIFAVWTLELVCTLELLMLHFLVINDAAALFSYKVFTLYNACATVAGREYLPQRFHDTLRPHLTRPREESALTQEQKRASPLFDDRRLCDD